MEKVLLTYFVAPLLILTTPVAAVIHSKQDVTLAVKSASSKDADGGSKGVSRMPQKVEIKGERFEITGTITAVSSSSFVVAGQTIVIDLAKVTEFEQKGILRVGNVAKVEGVIVNGSKFAREINVVGTGQGRFKFEVEDTVEGKGQTSVQTEVKVSGPVDQVIVFLEQVLTFLKGRV